MPIDVVGDQQQGFQINGMTEEKAKRTTRPAAEKDGKRTKPDWADGLRQLYDNVVNEPLPDTFADLISKLDESGK